MTQTTAIISGGVLVIGLALLFYWLSGDGLPKMAATSAGPVSVEEKTLMLPPVATGTGTEAIKASVPTSQSAGAVSAQPTEAVLKTSKGDITLRFASADAPKAVENFVKLARAGFYDGVKFHRVIKGFMIQAGDPLSKNDALADRWGSGGPGYTFPDEITAQSALYKKGYKRGVLAMANAGPNTNGSQFFIMHQDYPLPPLYTIFGEVVTGQDVVDAIAMTQVDPNDRPQTPIAINAVEIR